MPSFGSLLPPPLDERRGIPLYYLKSEEEVRQDVYERYDELVARQTALHLADELNEGYPFQPLLDYVSAWWPADEHARVADIGCSVGRLIGEAARQQPGWDCYGIDFSYQMLRQAREYWLLGKTLSPNLLRFGYPLTALVGQQLSNLHFALADAKSLPFPDGSLDLLWNTFLIDRLADVPAAAAEWHRVLRPGGRLVIVSPLNFLQLAQWEQYHPPVKLLDHFLQTAWELLDLTDPLVLHEPMDARGNRIAWRTLAAVLVKP
ncbi:class I SAM-dependent methyltransferase [Neolewinella maritima]|uniref:class I SAM-dependent methyltransferase n=1 Tax=Neolewinella maritima TaxID=1383882 RepID=UPI001EE91805|nr:class I SAM-dependent methyltransferase [Neolewinella maritima]